MGISAPHIDDEKAFYLPGAIVCKGAAARPGAIVTDVIEGRDAQAKGLVDGDEIMSLDGTDLTPLDESQQLAVFAKLPLNTPHAMTIRHADGTTEEKMIAVQNVLPRYSRR
jgi:S1-C subfamily serine protease